MTNKRNRLPNRRAHELFSLEHGAHSFIVGIGRFDDGRLAEIFINSSVKVGGEIEVLAKDGAICASIGLQHGIPIDVLRRALMRGPNGEGAGVLGAALDLIADEEKA